MLQGTQYHATTPVQSTHEDCCTGWRPLSLRDFRLLTKPFPTPQAGRHAWGGELIVTCLPHNTHPVSDVVAQAQLLGLQYLAFQAHFITPSSNE